MSQLEMPVPGEQSNTGELSSAEALYKKCLAIAGNLWWTWQPDVVNLFRDLDPIRWRQLDHNPIALLQEFTPERLHARATEMVLFSRVNHAYRRLKEYVGERKTWAQTIRPGWLVGRSVRWKQWFRHWTWNFTHFG